MIFLQKIFGERFEDLHVHKDIFNALFMDSSMTSIVDNFSLESHQRSFGTIEQGIVCIIRSLSYLVMESVDMPSIRTLSVKMHESIEEMDTESLIQREKRMHKIESRALFGVVIWMSLQGFDHTERESGYVDEEKMISENREYFSTTPWILFSIIWYLSMLKEASMSQTAGMPPVTQFPLSGIIYEYIHDRIK